MTSTSPVIPRILLSTFFVLVSFDNPVRNLVLHIFENLIQAFLVHTNALWTSSASLFGIQTKGLDTKNKCIRPYKCSVWKKLRNLLFFRTGLFMQMFKFGLKGMVHIDLYKTYWNWIVQKPFKCIKPPPLPRFCIFLYPKKSFNPQKKLPEDLKKNAWQSQKDAWQSQKICLTIPRKLPDNHQADLYSSVRQIVRHFDLRKYSWKHALQSPGIFSRYP